jgi:hypothetical protein
MPGIGERLGAVRERIQSACARAGRDPGEVVLVAVSKTRSVEEMREAFAAGQRHFGENRVQEAEAKLAEGLPGAAILHLVGSLQRNKARRAAGVFAVIHSIDSADLLARIDAAAPGPIELLCQVDLAGEPTKHGLDPDRLPELLRQAERLERARLVGLMLLPPHLPDPEQVRPYFRELRELREAQGGAKRLPHLSMGMSHDFEVAVEEGATLVRVGEAIFGPRARAA